MENLAIKDSPDDKKALLNRPLLPCHEVNDYCRQLPVSKYKSVKGTRNIHQVFNDTSNEKGLYHHQFACICENSLMQEFDECFYLKETSTTFSCCQHLIKAKWHSFLAKPENSKSDSEDSEDDSDDEVYYLETEASLFVKKDDDIDVIKTSNAHPYYLFKDCVCYIFTSLFCIPKREDL